MKDGKRVALVVIDCMRLDQWFALEPLLEEFFDIDRNFYCSVLPTATPYSRNAIFAGLLPAEIWKKHPDLWQEGGPNERTKNRYERQLLEFQLKRLGVGTDRNIKYAKIHTAEEAQGAPPDGLLRRRAAGQNGVQLHRHRGPRPLGERNPPGPCSE